MVGHEGGARYLRDATSAQVSEGSDALSVGVGAKAARGSIVTEVAEVGACDAAGAAAVADSARACGGGIVAQVAEAGGCNAARGTSFRWLEISVHPEPSGDGLVFTV